MSDSLTGWLDVAKAPKDTTYGSNTKWDTLAKAGEVKKVNTTFTLPAFDYKNLDANGFTYTFYQLNFIAGQPFTILNYLDVIQKLTFPENGLFSPSFNAFICYRNGTSKVRYRLTDNNDEPVTYPLYSGQLIKSGFSIEFGRLENLFGGSVEAILRTSIVLVTSLLNLSQGWPLRSPSVAVTSSALGYINGQNNQLAWSLPFNNPINTNSLGPFIDNSH